jgi:SAM-dependent methyltransferase
VRESTKSNAYRPPEFFARYLTGRVIDIGCGNDPVTAEVEKFDLAEGDANKILEARPAQSYDAVYSSHCLEHMSDPVSALAQWWALLKPGGYLVLVVPEENLYEQGYWPSIFNGDHKATFRISGAASWSPVSIDLPAAIGALPGAEIVAADVQDNGYDYRLRQHGSRYRSFLRKRADRLVRLGYRWPLVKPPIITPILRLFARFGTPIDQTRGDALAQIQVIARKHA